MVIDMSTLDSLNTKYVEILRMIDTFQIFYERVTSESGSKVLPRTKIARSLQHMNNMISAIGCSDYPQITDTIAIVEKYILCIDAVNEYKKVLLSYEKSNRTSLKKAVENVVNCQSAFEVLKKEYNQKYSYIVNSENTISSAMVTSISKTISKLQEESEEIKREAKKIISKEFSVELCRTEAICYAEKLPETMLIARYPVQKMTLQLMCDLGMNENYQNIEIDLKKQGNVMIQTTYDQMESEIMDNFILSYIFRYFEGFPVGTINIHIFDQNANYLYKRLCNCFQTENASEGTKRAIQLHSNLSDLTILRDANCEDIFKKTSINNPDLYSIYEHDAMDPFNLIILCDGLVDGSGYVSSEILDVVNSLSRPGDIGHKCGLRFLIIDNSVSFEKNLTPNVKHILNQIRQNCDAKIVYTQGRFLLDGKQTEVLHVIDDLDTFVQERAQLLAESLNNKEQNYVSISEVSADRNEEPGSIMYIPVGRAGNNIVELPLSCKDESGTIAGQCIGYMAIGQSGSGKSSFFHSLVLNGCMKYSPKDLQFWLLDFKNGGASSKYSQSGLPHIKMIAENNKIDDALCLFQMILEEMERRSKAFNKSFADNIVDYNKIATEKELEYFPRIIIAIDEVQEIFRDDNASVLQKLISSISTRMRSAGMHFVMVAQNLSDGKSYMLKDAFLPSATGRICFRVAADIPRDSGFDEEFIQRKQEISELKTGEAYISYGKDSIKKVKMAYTSPQEMKDKYFVDIKNKYPEYAEMRPLVIGAKRRLSICSLLQGRSRTFMDEMRKMKAGRGICSAVIAEDVYRMIPLRIDFSQHENSSVLLLGSDKQLASSLCSSFVLSLAKQGVLIHLFNGDRTKVQEEYDTIEHSFMYVCKNADVLGTKVKNHHLNEFSAVLKEIYSEYLRRQKLYQKAEDEDSEFAPMFLVINDLFAIEAFTNSEIVEGESENETNNDSSVGSSNLSNIDLDAVFEGLIKPTRSGSFRENVQSILSTLLKNGWRQNMHLILAIKGDPYTWRNSRVISDTSKIILFNTTDYADQMENTYYLKEMLKNISNDGEEETMAIWSNKKTFSKIRPIIYKLSNPDEMSAINTLIKGE